MKQLKKVLIPVFSITLFWFFGISDNKVDAAELENDITPLAYDTYVNITPKNQTRTASAHTFNWTTSLSGGNGRYSVTFNYGDGTRSSVSNHTSTTASWSKRFTLASGETQRTYRQQAVASSSGQAGTATATTTLKRF